RDLHVHAPVPRTSAAHLDGPLRPAQHVLERQGDPVLQIGCARLSGAARPTEEGLDAAAFARAEAATTEERSEEDRETLEAFFTRGLRVHAEPAGPGASGPRSAPGRWPEGVPVGAELVVALALFRIREHLVGLVDLLE